MKNLKSLKKNCNVYNIFLMVVIIGILFLIYRYSKSKGLFRDNMQNVDNVNEKESVSEGPEIMAADLVGGGSGAPASANGLTTSGKAGSSCNNEPVMNPQDLLPSDANKAWTELNPPDVGLKNKTFMKAGEQIGSISQVLRNPNLQLRSEPPNPQVETGPWNGTTIEGDPLRRPLEIGGYE